MWLRHRKIVLIFLTCENLGWKCLTLCAMTLIVFSMTYRCGWWSRWLAWLWSRSLSVLWDTHEDVWEADQRRTICAEQPSGNPHHQLLWATSEQSTAIRWAHSSLDYALCSEFIKWMCAVCCTMEFQIKCCTEKAFTFKCIFLDSFLKYIFCFLKKTVKRLIIMCLRLLG